MTRFRAALFIRTAGVFRAEVDGRVTGAGDPRLGDWEVIRADDALMAAAAAALGEPPGLTAVRTAGREAWQQQQGGTS